MNSIRIALFAIVGLLALAVGIWLASMLVGQRSAVVTNNMQFVSVIPAPRKLPDFDLIDQDEQNFGIQELGGRWTLLFMGFTNCGHICPMTMAKLRMISDSIEHPVDVLFVSVDPGRDTPAVIAAYVHGFDEKLRGITGKPEEIDRLATALGAPYFVDSSSERYIVDHSSAIFLINPDAALAATITAPHEVSPIISELNELLANNSNSAWF
jgi:protein SCO1/2